MFVKSCVVFGGREGGGGGEYTILTYFDNFSWQFLNSFNISSVNDCFIVLQLNKIASP